MEGARIGRVYRLLLVGIAAIAAVTAVAFGTVYTLSEAVIRRADTAPLQEIAVDRSPAAVARGKRLADIYGCTGCHGDDLAGSDYGWVEPDFIRLHASNLSRRLPDYSDGQIARAVRRGFDNQGRALWDMPSHGFTTVNDRDMADVIAFLRSRPPTGEDPPGLWFSWLARWEILTGALEPITPLVAQARAKPAIDLGPRFAEGRYLASTACAECHRSDLKGHDKTPDLMIAASYDLPNFLRLMRTGVAADGRQRGLMSSVARSRFSHFTDAEIAAIHAYLKARAEQAP